jgi:ABC-type glycerol-3-phosphate transport system permease component/peptidoglycan/LPS O-acetylase OafA/YrhL
MRVRTHPLVLGFFIVLSTYFAVPLLWLTMGASKSGYELATTPWYRFGQTFLLFDNIKMLFTFPGTLFPRWMANSLTYSLSSTSIAVLVATMAGYGLAVYKFKGSKYLQGAILFLAMVPANTLILPLYLMFAGLNLIETPWSVILPATTYPLGAFFVYYYLKTTLNEEVLDAARIDRAGEFRIFWKIGLPAARPAIAIIFLFSFIQSWNAFLLPLIMLSDPKLYPLTVGLGTSYGGAELVIASFVAMLPVLVVFLLMQRQVDINRLFHRPVRRNSWVLSPKISHSNGNLPPMTDSAAKKNLRVHGADGFRAVACLLVMFHHAAQRFNPDQSAGWIKALHFAGWRSEVGVALFFVLSGCLLSMPFWHAYVNALKGPSLIAYARNRIARIVPGVWLSLIVSTYVAVKILGGEFNPVRFFSGMFFVYSFHYKTFFPVDTNGPLWTVGLEAWCYICLPIVLAVVFKFKRNIKVAFIGMLMWVIFLQALQPLIVKRFMTEDYEKGWNFGMTGGAKLWMPYWNFASFFTMFLLGSIAALGICTVRSKGIDKKISWDYLSVIAIIAATFIVLRFEIPGTPDSFTKQAYLSPWYAGLIALGLFASGVSKYFWKVVDNRFFMHVARVSFGLYLWHWLFLIIVERKLPNDYWSNGANNIYAWLGMIVFTYSLTWAVAGLSYRYFESPILRWNRRDIARRSKDLGL